MSKKLAILTGGNGYLGSAVTKELISRGFEVASFSRSSADYPCDVIDAASVQAAVAKAVLAHGSITAAIHAASAPLERVLESGASPADVERQKSVALLGVENFYTAVKPHMQVGGAFIAITSEATKSPGESKMGAYVQAKKAMEEYVRSLRAPFRTQLYSVGFLPGGLNNDLPEQVKSFFSAKSKSVTQVAKEIADLCK